MPSCPRLVVFPFFAAPRLLRTLFPWYRLFINPSWGYHFSTYVYLSVPLSFLSTSQGPSFLGHQSLKNPFPSSFVCPTTGRFSPAVISFDVVAVPVVMMATACHRSQ